MMEQVIQLCNNDPVVKKRRTVEATQRGATAITKDGRTFHQIDPLAGSWSEGQRGGYWWKEDL